MNHDRWLKAQSDKVRDIQGILNEAANCAEEDSNYRDLLEQAVADLDRAVAAIEAARAWL